MLSVINKCPTITLFQAFLPDARSLKELSINSKEIIEYRMANTSNTHSSNKPVLMSKKIPQTKTHITKASVSFWFILPSTVPNFLNGFHK